MRLAIVCVGMVLAAFGAEDSWTRVKQLKSGTEVRLFKAGNKAGLIAKFDKADDERAVVIVKNEQKAIGKDKIERLEARPLEGGGLAKSSSTKQNDPAAEVGWPKPQGSATAPGLSSSRSSLSFEGKPAFELVHRRANGKQAQ